jgi:hypothetical protein
LFVVDPSAPKVQHALPLPGVPSDVAWLPSQGKFYIFFPETSELHTWSPNDSTSVLAAKILSKKSCKDGSQKCPAYPFRILVNDEQVLLSYRGLLLAASLENFQFRTIEPFSWMFVRQVELDAIGRLLALSIDPAGDENVSTYIISERLAVLAPVPNPSTEPSGVRHIYSLSGGCAVLLDNGAIFSASDYHLVGTLGHAFDDAYFPGGNLVTVGAEADDKSMFRITTYDSIFRPLAAAYVFQRPLLVSAGENPDTLITVMPEGSLAQIFSPLLIRSLR